MNRSPSRPWAACGSAAVAVLAMIVAEPSAPASAAGPPAGAPALSTVKTVKNTNSSGAGSLRAAIFKVNNPALRWDTIEFDIPGPGPHIISPISPLPALTDTVTIDGYSQRGAKRASATAPATLQIVIAYPLGVAGPGLELDTNGSVVSGLAVNGSSGDGIAVTGDENTLSGNYVGTDVSGEFRADNAGDGIVINGDLNWIGKGSAVDRNLISANDGSGISVESGTGTQIQANYIGTDATGTADRGNGGSGMLVAGDQAVITDNIVSGNGAAGIVVGGAGSQVLLNLVGLVNSSGTTTGLPNDEDGIVVAGKATTVGSSDAGNTVGANGDNGILVTGSGNTVSSNYVGIDPAGTLGLGNDEDGIRVTSIANEIGGGDPSLGNVASDNGLDGIHVLINGHGDSGDQVEHNLVGTDPTGVSARPNEAQGIKIEASQTPVRNNVVGFNELNGVLIDGDENEVSTNTVWLNGRRGVEVFGGTANPIVGNSIFDNGLLGIDLFPLGVTRNDRRDPDLGANDLMNFPIVTDATEVSGVTFVTWRYGPGLRNAPIRLEFFATDVCDGSTHGEAATPLGTQDIVTDNNGKASGVSPPLGVANPGQVATATATLIGPTSLLSTSELSNCVTVVV